MMMLKVSKPLAQLCEEISKLDVDKSELGAQLAEDSQNITTIPQSAAANSEDVEVKINKKKITALAKKLCKEGKTGKKSDNSSLYVIVDYKQLENAKKDNKEMLKSVQKSGTTFSTSLEERIQLYRNKSLGSDFKMIEVVRVNRDTSKESTYGLHFGLYIVVLEYVVHCLKEEFNEYFDSNPGFGKSASAINWFVFDFLDAHPDILTKIRLKIIDALKKGDYVKEYDTCRYCKKTLQSARFDEHACHIKKIFVTLSAPMKKIMDKPFQCGRCGNGFTTKYGMQNHQDKGTCIIDKAYFYLLSKFSNNSKLKTTYTIGGKYPKEIIDDIIPDVKNGISDIPKE
ncbi:hypothetical protein FO519_009588 [Halicephalobus sp. NKZ332]|nr:hypothetical protein FO519_009588 [Halicephalobus sp. NKZ332]